MPGQIELYREPTGDFRFRLKSRNGEIVATGPSYGTKAGARDSVTQMLKALSKAQIIDRTSEPHDG
jgi:uncharacterized protein YegP (UPF0339 family)